MLPPLPVCHDTTRWTAAASRSLVLKQCLQLPKPLWKEVLEAMGGDYAAAALEDVIE